MLIAIVIYLIVTFTIVYIVQYADDKKYKVIRTSYWDTIKMPTVVTLLQLLLCIGYYCYDYKYNGQLLIENLEGGSNIIGVKKPVYGKLLYSDHHRFAPF